MMNNVIVNGEQHVFSGKENSKQKCSKCKKFLSRDIDSFFHVHLLRAFNFYILFSNSTLNDFEQVFLLLKHRTFTLKLLDVLLRTSVADYLSKLACKKDTLSLLLSVAHVLVCVQTLYYKHVVLAFCVFFTKLLFA